MNIEKKIILPGTLLGDINTYASGNGTYIKDNFIYSSVSGFLILKSNNENKKIIEIDTKNKNKGLKIGSEVVGKVIKIKEEYIIVQILVLDNEITKNFMQGTIRKIDIRETEIDKIKIENCFLPGDIIKCRVISYGDSHRIYLGTFENDKGVLFAKNKETGKIMLPFDWKTMICPETGLTESRKVALPDFSYFTDEKST